MKPSKKNPTPSPAGMKTFRLRRIEDETGTSGTGIVAEGVEFTNGQCVMHWLTIYNSIGVYPTLKELLNIHSHNGKTVVEFYE